MATKGKNEVTPVNTGALAKREELPEYLRTGSNRGSEEMSQSDMVLPRLEIVQASSPIKETNEDAREGMFFNSATSELLGDTVHVIPVYFRLEYLIWKDQDEGGGFFGSYGTLAEAERRKAEIVAEGEREEFIEIVDTPVHFCLLVDPNDETFCQQIVVSMAKSKAKVSRKWNSMVQLVGGDRFSRVYKLTTFTDENKQGKKFKNFVVQPAGFPPESLFRIAEKTYDVIKSGAVRAGHEQVIDPEETSAPAGRGEI